MMPHAFAYLNDIIVIVIMNNLREVFRRLRTANLKINIDKCDLCKKELKKLGHKVTQDGICTHPDKVAAIAELKPPTNVKELRQYVGVASWYCRFVPDFAAAKSTAQKGHEVGVDGGAAKSIRDGKDQIDGVTGADVP
ncbi:hypothetical protein AWZ03_015326 [Drosophila navojoa]|uniref:Reverse transcriptase domain-containing protein n=1 Tax=Drosophila navojoa TaxID=7232 RepID=A0A484APW6_DRONA|nr:hypothetical protein AWZ03_015326 [Drosophila navojoa]